MKENGTPPPCHRLVDLPTSAWNKSIGNVDTIRNVISCEMAVHGHNSGPGSLVWDCLFDYTLYPGFWLVQYAKIEKQLERFATFKELQKAKKNITL